MRCMSSARKRLVSTATATLIVLTESFSLVSSSIVRPLVAPSVSTFMLMGKHSTKVGSIATAAASGLWSPQPPR